MQKTLVNSAYIDNTNVYKGLEAEGFRVEYAKLRKYLTERYAVKTAYIFIGFVPGNEDLYRRLQEQGFTLVFKPTVPNSEGTKGNCDGELILQATADFYEKKYSKAVIVTSDGDFACLVNFLLDRNALDSVQSPRYKTCSTLLTRSKAKIVFLTEVATLISRPLTPEEMEIMRKRGVEKKVKKTLK
ncbi:MAG: Uncharacterized protein Greene07147_894 [Parcubacteria group bacterium Greene0714_7]|nr:MAG: Uncharacterized protein Greene07147_894 [Parcubacteria group bacterium Greene0714_7]